MRRRIWKLGSAMSRWLACVVQAVAWATAQGCADEANGTVEMSARGSGGAEVSVCVSEAVGSSSSPDPPRPLRAGWALVGRACANHTDFILLDTAESAGALLRVGVQQLDGRGELDVRVTALTSETWFPSQAPQGVMQRDISFVPTGEAYMLSINLISDLPATSSRGRAYTASLQRLPRSMSDCCSSGEGPGCADDDVLTCLCQLDNACCGGPYDATCVAQARASCDLNCGSARSLKDCCTPSGTAGCSLPDVQGCVCAIDPYCCVGGFDESCVNLAHHRCGASCPTPSEESP